MSGQTYTHALSIHATLQRRKRVKQAAAIIWHLLRRRILQLIWDKSSPGGMRVWGSAQMSPCVSVSGACCREVGTAMRVTPKHHDSLMTVMNLSAPVPTIQCQEQMAVALAGVVPTLEAGPRPDPWQEASTMP